MRSLLVIALLAVAAANPMGYNYEKPKCPLKYASTKIVPRYSTKILTEYSTRVVPQYSTSYVTRTKVVPTYVYRTVVRTEYVPQEVVRTSTSIYVRNQVVTSAVQLPDQYITRDVYNTITKYRTEYRTSQVVRTKYQPTTVYRQTYLTEYVRSTVEVPRYVTTTKVQTVRGPASTVYKTEYQTSVYTRTQVLPAQTIYRTKTQTKVQEVVKSEYLPAVTYTSTQTQVVYRTSVYTDVQLMSRYTTVTVPVYVTNTLSKNLVRTQYVTSTDVRYTTVIQPQTEYVKSTRYVPTTEYRQATSVVRVTDQPRVEVRTVPVYVTSTVQLPDTINKVYRTKTQQQRVLKTVTVSRPEYRETTVTKTVQEKCGYNYPEPTVQLQYGK